MSAAATMPEEISRRWFDRFGRRVYEVLRPDRVQPVRLLQRPCRAPLRLGRPRGGGLPLAIVDEQDQELPRGQWGEIAIRGPA
jgi:non-ribosomal peptide synthetase component E (peptide arylation enzyme)